MLRVLFDDNSFRICWLLYLLEDVARLKMKEFFMFVDVGLVIVIYISGISTYTLDDDDFNDFFDFVEFDCDIYCLIFGKVGELTVSGLLFLKIFID